MAIVSSTILEDHAQPNGDRDICERHEFDDGHVIEVRYRGAAKIDADAFMAARVDFLEAQAAEEAAAQKQSALTESVAEKKDAYFASLSQADLVAVVGLTADEAGTAAADAVALDG